jgi:hypothetical protein
VKVYGVRHMQVATEPHDDPERSSLLDRIDIERSRGCTSRVPIS